MIIANQQQVTPAVLEAIARSPDPRFREIMSALVRHLHDFARDVKLTEREFEQAVRYVVAPPTENGGSIVRSPTPGPAMFVNARVRDTAGRPIEGAEVDVWHSSPEGFYEQQDPKQAHMNLRGKFTTDANGAFGFRSVKPAGYPIPIDGPAGDFVRATNRHHYRPAHLHFLIYKPGFKTLISQIYVNDDERLDSDVQFGVTRALIGDYVRHDNGRAPAPDVEPPWYSLDYTFPMEAGEARLPRPPIK